MKKFCLILFAGILLAACHKEPMDRTIFIPDEDDPELPAYSEWGYNSFGAEYERDYFLVSNKIVPCKIVYSSGQLQFALSGKISSNGKEMTLIFSFPFPEITDFMDLVQLNNEKINLSDSVCTVKILQDGTGDTTLNVSDGELHFKRAQLLSIDDKLNRVILSGTFELRFLQENFPANISDGRFDVGITKNYFHYNK